MNMPESVVDAQLQHLLEVAADRRQLPDEARAQFALLLRDFALAVFRQQQRAHNLNRGAQHQRPWRWLDGGLLFAGAIKLAPTVLITGPSGQCLSVLKMSSPMHD